MLSFVSAPLGSLLLRNNRWNQKSMTRWKAVNRWEESNHAVRFVSRWILLSQECRAESASWATNLEQMRSVLDSNCQRDYSGWSNRINTDTGTRYTATYIDVWLFMQLRNLKESSLPVLPWNLWTPVQLFCNLDELQISDSNIPETPSEFFVRSSWFEWAIQIACIETCASVKWV